MAFQVLYIYDYIMKWCSQQAEAIQNHEMQMFVILEKAQPNTENIRGLNLAAVKHVTIRVTRQPL
jgi:hypothetical protein